MASVDISHEKIYNVYVCYILIHMHQYVSAHIHILVLVYAYIRRPTYINIVWAMSVHPPQQCTARAILPHPEVHGTNGKISSFPTSSYLMKNPQNQRVG